MIEGAFVPSSPLTGVVHVNYGGGRGEWIDLAALAGTGEPTGDGMVPDDA